MRRAVAKKRGEGRIEQELDECVSILDLQSLNRNGGVLSPLQPTNSEWCNNRFSVFTVDSQQLLHLGVSEMLEPCTVSYLLVSGKEDLFD